MRRRARLGLAALALLAAGCTALPTGGGGAGRGEARVPAAEPSGSAPEPPAPEPAPSAPTATSALIEQSRLERAGGRYEAAAATLERALRIAPADPRLWLELAELRLLQNDVAQVRVLAQRALTLAAGDPAVERRARALLVASAD